MARNTRWQNRCCSLFAVASLLASGVPADAQTTLSSSSGTVSSTHTAPSTTTSSTPAQRAAPSDPPGSPQIGRSDDDSDRGVIFGDVIGPTIGDFKRLPSQDTLAWLGVGAAIALAAHPADWSTSRSLTGSDTLDATFEAGEVLGGALFQLAGSTATYLTGRATGNERVIAVGADLLRAQILAQTVTAAIKHGARRQRPDGTMYSFPSGHSSVSFASATVVQRHYGWKAGAVAYGMAAYVAASRIQEARHFLSDVAFGAAVGIAAGRTVTIGLGENRLAVAPTVTRGGGGVNFSLISD